MCCDEKNLLMLYSEWLDSQSLVSPPAAEDTRTHEDLVSEFMQTLTAESGEA